MAQQSATPPLPPTDEAASHIFSQTGNAIMQRRRRRSVIWRSAFLISTCFGVLALLLLLYNVVDGAFGYVAIQNEVDPDTVELDIEERRILAMDNVVESEDDDLLVDSIAADPYGIGFFGFAYYTQNQDRLRAITIDGILPQPDDVADGDYPITRPLYLYTTESILQEKPEVAAYIDFVNANVNDFMSQIGYFPLSDAEIARNRASLNAALGTTATDAPAIPSQGEFEIVGSSTVFPVNTTMLQEYTAAGYGGSAENSFVGTRAGFAEFCQRDGSDIAASSREIRRPEFDECTRARRNPIGFQVGNDAVAVVVSTENSFLQGATSEELRAVFSEATLWSDVNPDWPAQPINRYVPGRDSGTLDFFVEAMFDQELHELPKETLLAILEENVSAGLLRRLESDQPFTERTQRNVYELVLERVVNPTIARSWSLTDSLLRRAEIEEAASQIPGAELEFRSWITAGFLTTAQSSRPEFSGIRVAILGSLWVILITLLFALPVGVGAAIYLEEYAADNWFNQTIETNIANLAGVPSIIYGMLGLTIFVRVMEPLTSGTFLGLTDPTTANGRTVISAGLTLGLLILPIIIINAREAVRAVPASIRQAAYGLGATRWQTIWSHVLPSAIPGILTGNILAMSRAIGETAPLVVVGASTFILFDPDGPFSKFTTLPILIYQWTSRPQPEFRNLAAAAIIVLLLLLLTMNAAAVLLRNHYSRQRI
ncbi:MAG: phosphate ABC transporter permease PstA [Litorilinea sp.]